MTHKATHGKESSNTFRTMEKARPLNQDPLTWKGWKCDL